MKTRVTLEIQIEQSDAHPSQWNWPELLDMDDAAKVRVVPEADLVQPVPNDPMPVSLELISVLRDSREMLEQGEPRTAPTYPVELIERIDALLSRMEG